MFTLDSSLFFVSVSALGLLVWLLISITALFNAKFMDCWTLFPFVICVISLIFPPIVIFFIMALFLVLGPILFLKKRPKLKVNFHIFSGVSLSQKILTFFLLLYLVAKALKAFTPGAQNDVLTYALLAPKDWALFNDGVTFRPEFPNLFMSTYFEYFYYGYFVCFKSLFLQLATQAPTHFEFALAVMQIFAQLLVAVASYIFIPYLIFLINQKKFYPTFLTIIFIESLQLQTWTWYLAKNDAIPLFITLLAYYKATFEKKYRVSALYLGIALGVKFSNIYPVTLISLLLIYQNWEQLKVKLMVKVIPFFLMGFAPIFLRNSYFTGNPFYPVNILGFKNIYFAKKHMDYINLYSAASSFEVALDKTLFYFKSLKQTLMLALVSLVFKVWHYPLLMVLLIATLAKVSGPPLEWRLYSTLILFYILWIKALFEKTQVANLKTNYLWLLLLPFLFFSKFNVESFWKVPKILSEPTVTVLSREQDNFRFILDNNLKNYNVPNYAFVSSVHDIYYSRFKAISNDMGVEFKAP